MKASAFAYALAISVDNTLELLAAHGEKAKVLSGGQSLMPAMNLRLISPELIVDIGGRLVVAGTVRLRDAFLSWCFHTPARICPIPRNHSPDHPLYHALP